MPYALRTVAFLTAAVIVLGLLFPAAAAAHTVSKRDAFVNSNQGAAVAAFLYFGSKQMVTGYDHLAFLIGVVFFLYRLKDIVQYVSLFTLGHSIPLLSGVLGIVLIIGLFHGFGLATKLQELDLSKNGLVTNIVSFNVGVEIGQVLALAAVLMTLSYWRTRPDFLRHAFATNTALMAAGFVLVGYQIARYHFQA